jgi:hypothetical protein
MKKILFLAILSSLLVFSSTSFAVPIVYEGELFDGVTETGSVQDPFAIGSDWWFFDANAGDSITLQVNRLDENLDPALYLYSGLQSDTDTLPGYLASADDEIPSSGPFGDPLLNMIIPSAGLYTVAVWDFASGPGAPFDYEITLNGANPASAPVPEPATMLLLGTGLVGLAGASRKKLLKK